MSYFIKCDLCDATERMLDEHDDLPPGWMKLIEAVEKPNPEFAAVVAAAGVMNQFAGGAPIGAAATAPALATMPEKVYERHAGSVCPSHPFVPRLTIGTITKEQFALLEEAWRLIVPSEGERILREEAERRQG